MLSTKPYLVRAFYDWIIDSGCTPFIVFNVDVARCNVPMEYVENGEITFNLAPDAVRDIIISNDHVEFKASFSSVVRIISAPMRSVVGIYAEENGQGMFFDLEEEASATGGGSWSSEPMESQQSESYSKEKKQSSHLRLVE